MIERKYPSQIIDSLIEVYPDKNFSIDYVGIGRELETIKSKIEKYQINEQVNICGHISRNSILDKYDNADCMIMISKHEAYGLVYLEAMARGCITIAAKQEGFDGIIKDGVNGFLCKAGDHKELASVIQRINNLTAIERQEISDRAIETAKWLTDKNAANMYLNDLMI